MTEDQLNDLTRVVQQLNEKTDTLSNAIARVDTKVENTKYLTRLLDVQVQYPAENDILVYDKTGKWKNAQYDEVGLQPGEGGEGSVYVIGIGDDTPPTNENVYAAALIHKDYFKKEYIADGDASQYVNNPIVLKKHENGSTPYIIADTIKSTDAIEDSVAGKGLIYKVNNKGKSYIEVDDLSVRRTASFNTLEVKKVTAVGGNLVISLAANTISSVEEASVMDGDVKVNVWRCRFKNSESGDNGESTKITNDFIKGDLVRIQEFNISESSTNTQNRFYWGKVVNTGDGYVDLDKTGLDGTNTTPKAGDNLVQYGNLSNVDRSNIITLSTNGNNAPSIIMYQNVGIGGKPGQSTIEMAYDKADDQNQAYMNVYGRMYIGNRDQTSYVKFDPTLNKVQIKAEVVFEGTSELAQDLIAKKLGYTDWNNMSTTGQTIIKGGVINTDLINAQAIIASAGKITNELQVGNNFKVNANGIMTAVDANITGKISSKNNGFSLNADGSGQLANNAFSWQTNGQFKFTTSSSGNRIEISSAQTYIKYIGDDNKDYMKLEYYTNSSGSYKTAMLRFYSTTNNSVYIGGGSIQCSWDVSDGEEYVDIENGLRLSFGNSGSDFVSSRLEMTSRQTLFRKLRYTGGFDEYMGVTSNRAVMNVDGKQVYFINGLAFFKQ